MDKKVINNIRSLSIDMINEARSGHPGIALGAAPVIYTLFANHLNFNKEDGNWINRDRFILSAGHGSALLYSTLVLAGYPITFEDMKKYRQIDGKLKSNPELNKEIGVEITTGLLGEGFASGVGMAIGEEYLGGLLGRELINHYTYVLVSDGDLMQGISYEAASLAGTLKLGKLIVLYDSNDICTDGKTSSSFSENVLKRFEACGWHTELVNDGENISLIDKAINNSKSIVDKPSIIEIKTIIGKGSLLEGTNKVHGRPLDEKDILQLKNKMGFNEIPFHISKDSTVYFREKIDNRIVPLYNEWIKKYNQIYETKDNVKLILNYLDTNKYNLNLKKVKIELEENEKEELRISNGKLMNLLSELLPLYMSLSADLFSSTDSYLEKGGNFSVTNRLGKNIELGSRENLMSGVMNGLALCNIRCTGSTFLAFSDYMRPGMRLASLMDLPVTYLFTHDSINIGENGPTYQPVEQLANLRSIPNMTVFRPADVREIVGCWDYIINNQKPVSLVVSKEATPVLSGTKIEKVENGAYVVKEEVGRLSSIIMATGTEVNTALMISDELRKKGISVRVISVPSLELFEKQSEEYKAELLPIGSKVIVIEASNDKIWKEFVYNKKYILNIKEFGTCGKRNDVLQKYDFDFESLLERVETLIK